MFPDVLVLVGLDRAIGGMDGVPEILHKNGVDAQDCIFETLHHHHVADGQRPQVATVFKTPRIECLLFQLVENLATVGPFREYGCRSGRNRARNVFVFVVFLGSPDD